MAGMAALAALVSCLASAFADPAVKSDGGPRSALLFSIAKSENKNQVEYAVRLNERCVPVSDTPVFAYWRMLEEGPNRTAPLLPREMRAYGIARQRVRVDGGVQLVLAALPKRSLLVRARRAADGTCSASVKTTIAGSPAYLFNVYLKLKWLFRIEYVLLRGWSLDRTHVVTERLEP
jgi:hypothetical protein